MMMQLVWTIYLMVDNFNFKISNSLVLLMLQMYVIPAFHTEISNINWVLYPFEIIIKEKNHLQDNLWRKNRRLTK